MAASDPASQGCGVKYQDDVPVTKLSGSRDAYHLNKRIADWSNHDFALAQNPIYGDGDLVRAAADYECMKNVSRLFSQPKQGGEPLHRQNPSAIGDDLVVLNRGYVLGVNLYYLADERLRDGESLAAGGYNKRVGDSQSKRQLNREPGSAALLVTEVDGSAQSENRLLDDAEPHTAAACPVGLVSGRKAGRADQVQQHSVFECGQCGQCGQFGLRAGEALGPSTPGNMLRIDTSPIIFNLDDDHFGGGRCPKRNLAFGGFPHRKALAC